jgi:hypothetical protein
LCSDGIVKFGASGQNCFNKFLRRVVADGFRHRMQSHAEIKERLSHVKMIFGVPREAIYFVNHESVNLAFVFPAVFNSAQKLRSLGGFGRGSFFSINTQNLNALALAIGTAKLILIFQGCAFDLFLTGYSYVNYSVHIFVFRQLKGTV